MCHQHQITEMAETTWQTSWADSWLLLISDFLPRSIIEMRRGDPGDRFVRHWCQHQVPELLFQKEHESSLIGHLPSAVVPRSLMCLSNSPDPPAWFPRLKGTNEELFVALYWLKQFWLKDWLHMSIQPLVQLPDCLKLSYSLTTRYTSQSRSHCSLPKTA